jgi:hypothetical protein
MVEINLLPWRDYTRDYENKVMKKTLLTTLLLTALILVGIHHILSKREAALQAHLDMLQKQPQQLQWQSVKPVKTSRPLHELHPEITILFEELKKMRANEVCFTDIIRNNNMTLFMGKAYSAADLTNYLKNWRAAYLFSQININQLEQKNGAITQFRFEAMKEK